MAKIITVLVPAGQPEVITLGIPGFQGVPGPQGIQGIQGPVGPKGDPGDLTPSSALSASGTHTFVSGNLQSTRRITLSGNLTIGTLPTPAANVSGTISIVLAQAATGGPYTITWPTLKWANGATPPTMPTAAGSVLVVHLFWTGIEWLGAVMGTYF